MINGSMVLTTKVRAMYSKRLKQQDYKELVRKQSVSEIATYIKQTFYADALRDVNESSIHRGQLESVIRQRLFADYVKMLHYVNQDDAEFYNFFKIRMEIDEILSCVRYLNAGHGNDYIFSLPSYLTEHSKLDLSSYTEIKSYDDLLNLLRATPYFPILKHFMPELQGGQKRDITDVEKELNKYYYSYLFHAIDDSFKGEVRKDIRNSFGMEVDLFNITEIIRLKKYFSVKGDDIKKLLLPYYFNVKPEELNAMIAAPDIGSATQTLYQTRYGHLFTKNEYDYIEWNSRQMVYDYNRSLLRFTMSAPVSVIAYLKLKRTEINNLISIIEGVRYGVRPAEIEKLLIGTAS